jgi:hypothetical protein
MFDGPDLGLSDEAAVVTATLTGPAGLVPVAVADNHTTGLHGYLPTGAELIPRSPLAPLTKYTASITASVTTQDGSGPARNFTHNWSFTTGVLPNSVRVTAISVLGRRAKVTVTSEAPGAIVVASGPGPSVTKPVGSDGTATLDLTASGTWNMCAASGGGTSGYAAAQDCRPIVISAGSGRPAGKPFGVSVPKTVAAGRRIVVKITSRASFSLRLTLRTPAGRVLVDGPAKTLAGGMTWIYRLPVAAPAGKAGHKVKLELKIRTGGKRYTVKRTVRFT